MVEKLTEIEWIAHYQRVNKRLVNPPPKPVAITPLEPPQNDKPLARDILALSGDKTIPVIHTLPPTFDQIMRVICARYGVTVFDMKSERRGREISFPRHVFCHLSATLTLASFARIGRWLGGRDHTTILYANRKIVRLRAAEHDFDVVIRRMIEQLGGRQT